ncbi:MauE/DoxX family redox-associated membrane protein [Cellulomonas sp. ATA003]|uniref:DoxX family protein n=1 Tax=Cellulomonas sp. ATA003 TaxID=3073064 RepID=UPI002872C09D|nr:MauE/DoxX family redox-associated membrane protein [Cellulomonas sp. ATA003]WNB85369.1 MauE/DoxX family redox-associated membrane protein [Cellulomonas sp. ATA003]
MPSPQPRSGAQPHVAAPPTGSSPAAALGLAALLTAAGVTHLTHPRLYDRLVPRWLGRPRAWVLGSGVVELACAAAVAVPRTRHAGALATAGLFVAVFPGNVQMALDSRPGARSWARRPVVAWGRLPLQVPLVLWAWRVARTSLRP